MTGEEVVVMRPGDKGRHPILEQDHPYIFIDSCMQIWPDADFATAHRLGVTAYAVTAWNPHATLEQAIEGMMYWHLIARKYPDIVTVNEVKDIRQAKRDGKAALLLVSQCGDFIGNKLHRIEALYRLGLRMMILTYNSTNHLCDGCLDRTDSGLTRFGELVVDECNRIGLLLDCSHIGGRAALEIIERSRQPVVFSHANAKTLADNPRNIGDEQIKACAAKGGVIAPVSWGPLVLRKGQTEWPSIDDFIEHIDYVAQLTGSTDHIGIATDMSLGIYPDHWHDPWGEPTYKEVTKEYDEQITTDIRAPERAVNGFSHYAEIVNLIDKLQQRGYSDDDVRKMLGENYLRVFAQVWEGGVADRG